MENQIFRKRVHHRAINIIIKKNSLAPGSGGEGQGEGDTAFLFKLLKLKDALRVRAPSRNKSSIRIEQFEPIERLFSIRVERLEPFELLEPLRRFPRHGFYAVAVDGAERLGINRYPGGKLLFYGNQIWPLIVQQILRRIRRNPHLYLGAAPG